MDSPLYALAKQVQWCWPETMGEESMMIMLGGLHTDMAAFRSLSIWLADSGWTDILVTSEVTTPGTADSFLKVSHITKTRHAHQVTAAALYILQQKAYNSYTTTVPQGTEKVDFGTCQCVQCCERSRQFKYWSKTLQLQLTVFTFIRSQREGNVWLYIDSLSELNKWYLVLDQINYGRCVPLNIHNLKVAISRNDQLSCELQMGNSVIHQTANEFSAIVIDQAHKQKNALVKSTTGAVGLT